nr:heme-binding protein [uncultured Gimesia sp.]
MSRKKLIRDGAAECAGYDPPWTPGPFRRNEVLVRIK